MNEMMVSNKEIISLKDKAHDLEKTIKNHVCTIIVPPESKDPSDKLAKVMTKVTLSKVEMKKLLDNLTLSQTELSVKEKQLKSTNLGNNQLTKNIN